MRSVACLELREQVPDVGFHRFLTDVETNPDFAVGEAIGHELKHGELAVAGPVRRQFAERHPWDYRRRMKDVERVRRRPSTRYSIPICLR